MRLKIEWILTVGFLILAITSFPKTYALTQWAPYVGNPVLVPTEGSWDSDYVTTPRVLFDGTTYRMWYLGGHSGVSHVGYSTSTNGITWIKHEIVLSAGQPGQWDSSSIGLGSVLWNGSVYMMWYTGTNGTVNPGGSIGLATSTDGLNWVKYPGNPVLTPSELGNDQKYIATPYVVKLQLAYNMWYTGKSISSPSINKILFATSPDGIHWIQLPKPVLPPSTDPTAWDAGGVYAPSVMWNVTTYGLWYSAINTTGVVPRIGFATSPDGQSWTRSAAPILAPGPPGSWDSSGVEQPTVVHAEGVYKMFYDGYSNLEGQRIGLALSPIGFTIAEFPTPVFALLVGLAACSTLYLTSYRRRKASG